MENYAICLLSDKIYNYTEKIVFYKNSWSFSNKNSLGSVQLIFSDFTSKWDLHHMESTVPIPLWLGLVWVLCKFQILHHETFLQWFHTLDHKTKNLSLFVVRIYLDFFFWCFIFYNFQTDYDDMLKYLCQSINMIIPVIIVTSRLVRKREQLSGCLMFPISITTLLSPLLSFKVNRSSRVAVLTAANTGLNTANSPPGDISGILSEVASFYLPIWEFCQSPFLLNEFNQWALCFWKLESFSMNILSFQQV